MYKPNLAIDLDGVIHSYHKGFHNGEIYGHPVPGVREFLEKMREKGFRVVIFTARVHAETSRQREILSDEVASWLDLHRIPFDVITDKKVPACAYIDDRAISFRQDEATTWDDVESRVDFLADSYKRIG